MQLSAEAVLGVCGTVQCDTSRHLLHSRYRHTQELKQLSGGRGTEDEETERVTGREMIETNAPGY